MFVTSDSSIKECILNISFDSQSFAKDFEDDAVQVVYKNLLPALSSAITEVDAICVRKGYLSGIECKIKNITLNLDDVFSSNPHYSSGADGFTKQICNQITHKFKDQLLIYIEGKQKSLSNDYVNNVIVRSFQFMDEFLLAPIWPSILSKYPHLLISNLYTFGRDVSFRRSLSKGFSDHWFYNLIRVLEPTDYKYIETIIRLASNTDISKHSSNKALHKNPVVVKEPILKEFTLSYLLSDRGSKFNRKEYLKSFVKQMADHQNMQYSSVLESLKYSLSVSNVNASFLIDMNEVIDEALGGVAFSVECEAVDVDDSLGFQVYDENRDVSLGYLVDILSFGRVSNFVSMWSQLKNDSPDLLRDSLFGGIHLCRVRNELCKSLSQIQKNDLFRLLVPSHLQVMDAVRGVVVRYLNSYLWRSLEVFSSALKGQMSHICSEEVYFSVSLNYLSNIRFLSFSKNQYIMFYISGIAESLVNVQRERVSFCRYLLNLFPEISSENKNRFFKRMKFSNKGDADLSQIQECYDSIYNLIFVSFYLHNNSISRHDWSEIFIKKSLVLLTHSPVRLHDLFLQLKSNPVLLCKLIGALSDSDKIGFLKLFGSLLFGGQNSLIEDFNDFSDVTVPSLLLPSSKLTDLVKDYILGEIVDLNGYAKKSDYYSIKDTGVTDSRSNDQPIADTSCVSLGYGTDSGHYSSDKLFEDKILSLLSSDINSLRRLMGYDPQSYSSLWRLISKLSDIVLLKVILALEKTHFTIVSPYVDCLTNACYGEGSNSPNKLRTCKWFFIFHYFIALGNKSSLQDFIFHYFQYLLVDYFDASSSCESISSIAQKVSHNVAANMCYTDRLVGKEVLLSIGIIPRSILKHNHGVKNTGKGLGEQSVSGKQFMNHLKDIKNKLGRVHEVESPKIVNLAVPGKNSLNEDMITFSGIVLIAPYIPMLLKRLGLIKDDSFINIDSIIKSTHVVHYLVTGNKNVEFEYISTSFVRLLNVILGGVDLLESRKCLTASPPISGVTLSAEEEILCDSLLDSVVTNWRGEGRMSLETIREEFFQRSGLLVRLESGWELQVHPKSFDVILSSVPWGFRLIKFPWMTEPLKVTWGQ